MPGDPRSFLFCFPGQGSQYRGMGQDLFESFEAARRVYERASDALGWDMAELSFRDPEGQLNKTAFTQPALLTHSVACMEVFRDLTGGSIEPSIAAGHSLGEYTALVAAGVLSFEDAVRLVRRRGELMSEYGRGKMLAFTLGVEQVRRYAERHYCGIGGCNLPNQTVVGGMQTDLEALLADMRSDDAKVRGTPLNTEGAFHTYLMVDAAVQFRVELKTVTFHQPRCGVLSNYSGDFHEPDADGIRYRLFFQLFHPVRWIWGFQRALEQGIGTIVEFGGGLGGDSPASMRPNLASIIKRTIRAREGRHGRRTNDTTDLDYEALYTPAINVETARQAAHLSMALRRLEQRPADLTPGLGSSDGERRYRLYVPTVGGLPMEAAIGFMRRVEELAIGDKVELIAQPAPANAAFVATLDPGRGPAPVLETVIGGEQASVLRVFDNEIEATLVSVRDDGAR